MHRAVRRGTFLRGFKRPFDAWAAPQRSACALAVALGVFVLGTRAWSAMQAPHRAQQLETSAKLARNLTRARATVAALPAARAAPMSALALLPEPRGPAEAMTRIAELVARSGLTLTQIEPLADRANQIDAEGDADHRQTVHLRAHGPYAAIALFAENLATLPIAVVPGAARIRRETAGLGFDAALRIVGSQHGAGAAAAVEAGAASTIDPFVAPVRHGKDAASGSGELVGVLSSGERRAALVEFADDLVLARVGDTMAGMTVTHIGDSSVTLASAARIARTLDLGGRRE